MHWSRWVVVTLVILNAGWMLFDGCRALIVGDYVTPKTGRHAGELGPWSKVTPAVGIPPRSTLMKAIFVVYGLVYLGMLAVFLSGASWSRWGMILMAVLGLWYLPFGTVVNLLVLALLQLPSLRGGN